jgi:Transposase
MRKSKFTAEQIADCLTQAAAGVPIGELCRKCGISQ